MMTLFAFSSSAFSGALEALLSPGDLITGHQKYQADCNKCHSPLEDTSQTTLCRDCHEKVDTDIHNKMGFHGLNKQSIDSECRVCHTDHEGKNFDITPLDPDHFDHLDTDFRLDGIHTQTSCNACHKVNTPYRDTPHECVSCHEKDDIHRNQQGDQCEDCHSTTSWRNTEFDHDATDFSLIGKHAETQCAACHIDPGYQDTPTECNDCHQLDDYHQGRFGDNCGSCHSPKQWDKSSFDHDNDTDYPLKGKHNKVECNVCHTKPIGERETARTCIACHDIDDPHNDRFGSDCAQCHIEKAWDRAKFDHSQTDFPLRGKHEQVHCESCHRASGDQDNMPGLCYDCHQSDDVHNSQQGHRCGQCHSEQGWGEKIRFDHDLGSFPLVGMHAATSCDGCHLDGEFANTPLQCIECHDADDTHNATLGEACETCHNPNDWALWIFDHDKTDFPLDGAHSGIECAACHTVPGKQVISPGIQCISCHQRDDTHSGEFGRYCERCHNTESFESGGLLQ